MPCYVKVSIDTGEFHERECGECGFLSISGADEDEAHSFQEANKSDGHIVIEITSYEKDALVQISHKTIERGGEVMQIPYYEDIQDEAERRTERFISTYKLDMTKIMPNLKDRLKIDVPIEVDGVGGKEIIGYEQKPESIIIERSDQIDETKPKLEK